jgi:hypothetical protein
MRAGRTCSRSTFPVNPTRTSVGDGIPHHDPGTFIVLTTVRATTRSRSSTARTCEDPRRPCEGLHRLSRHMRQSVCRQLRAMEYAASGFLRRDAKCVLRVATQIASKRAGCNSPTRTGRATPQIMRRMPSPSSATVPRPVAGVVPAVSRVPGQERSSRPVRHDLLEPVPGADPRAVLDRVETTRTGRSPRPQLDRFP